MHRAGVGDECGDEHCADGAGDGNGEGKSSQHPSLAWTGHHTSFK
jgi:hypothetical protein